MDAKEDVKKDAKVDENMGVKVEENMDVKAGATRVDVQIGYKTRQKTWHKT